MLHTSLGLCWHWREREREREPVFFLYIEIKKKILCPRGGARLCHLGTPSKGAPPVGIVERRFYYAVPRYPRHTCQRSAGGCFGCRLSLRGAAALAIGPLRLAGGGEQSVSIRLGGRRGFRVPAVPPGAQRASGSRVGSLRLLGGEVVPLVLEFGNIAAFSAAALSLSLSLLAFRRCRRQLLCRWQHLQAIFTLFWRLRRKIVPA